MCLKQNHDQSSEPTYRTKKGKGSEERKTVTFGNTTHSTSSFILNIKEWKSSPQQNTHGCKTCYKVRLFSQKPFQWVFRYREYILKINYFINVNLRNLKEFGLIWVHTSCKLSEISTKSKKCEFLKFQFKSTSSTISRTQGFPLEIV